MDDEKAIGTITSEPKKMGNNFYVLVVWDCPRKVSSTRSMKEETHWITALISDEIDFMAWREDQLNG